MKITIKVIIASLIGFTIISSTVYGINALGILDNVNEFIILGVSVIFLITFLKYGLDKLINIVDIYVNKFYATVPPRKEKTYVIDTKWNSVIRNINYN